MADREIHVHRRAAVRVGGQRQRNRLSRVPRSTTMPVLLPSESMTAGASSNVHLGVGVGVTSQEGANAAHRPEGASALDTSQSMMSLSKLTQAFEASMSDSSRSAL
jgi:hypothetical protein